MDSYKIDHIGWITNDSNMFEAFWCHILGYEEVGRSEMAGEMCLALFGFTSEASIRRYRATNIVGPDIEIHVFKDGSAPASRLFHRFGINHICLHTGGPGSRSEFLSKLPINVRVHCFNNPKGWQNIFIRDYDENWIELRESL